MMIDRWPNGLGGKKSNNNRALMITSCPGGQLCILEVNNENAILHSVVRFAQGSILSGVVKGNDGYMYVSGLNHLWQIALNRNTW